MGKGSNSRSPLSADPLPPPKKSPHGKTGLRSFLFRKQHSHSKYTRKEKQLGFFWGGGGLGEFLSEWVIPSMARNIFFSPLNRLSGGGEGETKASRALLECPQRERAAAQMFLKTSLEFRASDTVGRTRLGRKIHQSPIYLKGYFYVKNLKAHNCFVFQATHW